MNVAEKQIETFCPKNRQHWRQWLQENHAQKQSVWLIYHKKKSGNSTVTWSEAVDEALCFGWIDSRSKPIDDYNYMQFFSRRKPKSIWSKINKEKVEQLINNGLMSQAGLAVIETAKKNGCWAILDEVEAGVIPADLANALQDSSEAQRYFFHLSKSDRRTILQWLVLAKRPETRQKRIADIVDSAERRLKPDALQWPKQ